MAFRAGDVVKRVVDGTEFVLAVDEQNGRIGIAGWPSSWENANLFVLEKAATDGEREEMLRRIATSKGHSFKGQAQSDYMKGLYVPFRKESPGYYNLGEVFENPAGVIRNIYEGKHGTVGGVSLIESNEGAIRSNHWHREDAHVLYVIKGAMLYFEAEYSEPMQLPTIPTPYLVREGSAIYTGSKKLHATAFERETLLLSISRQGRTHDSHEQDVVRVPWVTPDHMKNLVPWVNWQ